MSSSEWTHALNFVQLLEVDGSNSILMMQSSPPSADDELPGEDAVRVLPE